MRISSYNKWITLAARQQFSPILGLVLITFLAASLRFYKLGEWSFWIDEIFTVNRASAHFTNLDQFLQYIPPASNWFPLSVILTAQAFNLWGVSEFAARLVPAFIGVVTIPILYFPIKKIFNTRVALVAVLLLALSNWHIEWSQNARGYTSLMLLYTLALFTFYFAVERDRPVYFIPFYIFLYLAASERMIAFFLLPVLLVYLLAIFFLPFGKPAGLRLRNALLFFSPMFAFGILMIIQALVTGESILSSAVDEIIATFVGNSIESPFTQAVFTAFKIGIPLLVFSLMSGVYFGLKRNRPGLYFSLGAVVPYALVISLTAFMFTEERYVFVAFPCWVILAALGIDALASRLKKADTVFVIAVLLTLAADMLGTNLTYYRINNGNRRDWKQAFALVQANLRPGDQVVATWPQLGGYYLKRDVEQWDEISVDEVMHSQERIWFIVIPDMTWYTGTEDLYWWISRNTRMITTYYLRTVDNTNLEIYLYDPALKPDFQSLK
jgi:4-amino-4-deoxy-L-arabinose transferase-like glycosyltransferase